VRRSQGRPHATWAVRTEATVEAGTLSWTGIFFGRRSNSTPARSGLPRGFDEGDQISGDGSADLQNDGSIEIALSFDNGDDAVLIARRE
jgi:hypothetical protein